MAAMISYIPVSPTLMGTENKARVGPTRGEKRISRTIDTLQAMAKREQSKRWGDSWAQDMHDFFELNYYPASASPSYRPKVIMPELQYLLMGESSELTNDTPKPYISVNGKRDEERERAFSALWKRGMFNNRIFDAVLWSQFCNPASLQVGYNPDMRYGRGSVWIASRDVDTFFPDANAKNDRDWAFVVAEDWFYVDEVKRVWGDSAKEIKVDIALNPKVPLGNYSILVRGKTKFQNKDFQGSSMPAKLSLTLPFTLKVEPADLKLVQGGKAKLKITAIRKAGYQGPIAVEVRKLPAGVTATKGTIAMGQTAVEIEITAAADAAVADKADIQAQGSGADKQSVSSPNLTIRVGKK